MKRRIAVIGDGGWGTALALVLHGNGHKVTVWSPFPENVTAIRREGENLQFMPGVELPPEIRWTSDREEAAKDAEVLVLAVPTKYFRHVVRTFRGIAPDSCMTVSAAKGLDAETRKRMSVVARDLLGRGPVAALSGPSHAQEVARKIPTAVVIATEDAGLAGRLQTVFSNQYFRVYTSEDVAGVEYGGTFKNVIALAVGVNDGIGFGHNTRAALITRGLAEMTRLGCALGAKAATFAGLSGMGDLIVTCTSRLSRNWTVGERIGKGERIGDILGATKLAVEGVWNCGIARELAHEAGIDVPITEQVYAVIHEKIKPRDAVKSLMTRDLKPEEAAAHRTSRRRR